MSSKVAVIGAGLTGLTTAYYLCQKGIDVTVFEQADEVGGVIQTRTENGFTYENGPSTGVLGTPEAAELLEELADEAELEIADEDAKYRWIWKGNRWVPIPSGLFGGIVTPLFKFSDKLRLLGEPFRKPGTNPNESLADLVRRRMGKSFLTYAIDPFILGIYSGDPEKLVTKYALPKLYNLEQDYGSFIGGAIKKAREPKSDRDKKATREVFSVKGGLGNLIHALERRIGTDRIVLKAEDLVVNPAGTGYQVQYKGGEAQEFQQVISTIGAYNVPRVFPFLPQADLEAIRSLPQAKVVQVSVGFKKWQGMKLKAFGGLVPFCENRQVLGALFLSSFLKNRAPQGGALISTFLGGVRKPDMVNLSDDELKSLVQQELMDMLQLKEWNPDLVVINRYQYAIPQYGIESEAKLQAVKNVEANFPGLLIGGNLKDGIGMADRIKQGRTLAGLVQ